MNISSIITIVFIILLFFWGIGVGIIAYHVFKYRLPNDASVNSLWIYLFVSGLTLLYVIYVFVGSIVRLT